MPNCDAFWRFDYTNGIGVNVWGFAVNFVAIEGSLAGRIPYFQPIFCLFFQP